MVSFKMFAGTNVGLRENNEDNFTVCPDLMKNEWIVPADNQQVIQLGQRGCVMVVADGMGGQNAGEVASAIAIYSVQEMFSPDELPANVIEKPDTIKQFLKKVVSECDFRIKQKAKEDSSTAGMGSTIVISWLVNDKLYIAWLGDSRAYSFVPKKGIARLSRDHSYVQQLVDAGAITEDEAMDHPNSNVIIRSLGDTSQKAKADVVECDVEDGQIILLCSDGLCGVCKDEEIGGVIEEEYSDLQKCKECLTTAALAAGGSDNITISLMQISKGADGHSSSANDSLDKPSKYGLSTILSLLFGTAILLTLLYAGYTIMLPKEKIAERFVRLSVDNNTLDTNEKTTFHISISDNNLMYNINYDKTLLAIDTTNNVISRVKTNQPILEDSVTIVKIVSKEDSSICDSVRITLKKMVVSVSDNVESHTSNTTRTSDSNDLESNKTDSNETKYPEEPKETNVPGKPILKQI